MGQATKGADLVALPRDWTHQPLHLRTERMERPLAPGERGAVPTLHEAPPPFFAQIAWLLEFAQLVDDGLALLVPYPSAAETLLSKDLRKGRGTCRMDEACLFATRRPAAHERKRLPAPTLAIRRTLAQLAADHCAVGGTWVVLLRRARVAQPVARRKLT